VLSGVDLKAMSQEALTTPGFFLNALTKPEGFFLNALTKPIGFFLNASC